MTDKLTTLNLTENTKIRVGLFLAVGAIVFAFTVGVSVTNLENRVSAVEEKAVDNDKKYSDIQKTMTQLLIQQAQSQTTLLNLQTDVTDIKKKI